MSKCYYINYDEDDDDSINSSYRSEDESKYGYFCVRCKDFFDYAEANQEDGTFKCFLCRKYPYR